MLVKCFGLLSEVIANVSFRGNSVGATSKVQLTLGILIFIFGFLEGALGFWESRTIGINSHPNDTMAERV